MDRIKLAKNTELGEILFLKGIHKNSGLSADLFHARLLGEADFKGKIFGKIPHVFTDLSSWPKTTNLNCWHCTRLIKDRPWFEPQSLEVVANHKPGEYISADKLDKSGVVREVYNISVEGYFCSPNCVAAYTNATSKDLADRINKKEMLLVVHEIFTGVKVMEITPSPKHTVLEQYGGDLTNEAFQKIIDDFNSKISTDTNNFINQCKILLEV